MLTQFFEMNKINTEARKWLYRDFPEHFVWHDDQRYWSERKKEIAIGRIVTANPIEGERYYLRLLLNHVRGPMSFHDLQCFNEMQTSSFREAALLRGLLESDNSFEECLQEASQYQMPQSLRRLFATILVYCNPSNPKLLWDKFEDAMSEDYNHLELSSNRRQAKVLANINSVLQSMGKNITDYAFVDIDIEIDEEISYSKEIEEELNISASEQDLLTVHTLNEEQKQAYNIILERIFSHKSGAFFIDGPGGTGKTYLYRALLSTMRSRGFIALATATSGVAASILPGGRTAHSRFKIPLNIEEIKSCHVSKQGSLAQLIQMAKLIIWDEASMAKKEAIEAFNQMLQDITDSQLPFGGKVVVFGGDFRQVLPVVPRTNRHEAIKASLVTSQLWPTLEKIKLTENMRARFDPLFSQFLLRVGNGTENATNNDKIKIPNAMVIPFKDEMTSMADLIKATFPNLEEKANNSHFMATRAILSPKNDFVDEINDLLINQFPGSPLKYYSFDSAIDDTGQLPQEEFLNSLTPNGLPPHELILKVNCPIMLLRNIDPPTGLCNGTRLVCRTFTKNLIDAEIIAGHYHGKRVFIPRIPLQPAQNDSYPFMFKRKQFPIRLSFAMTINKAQGQTLEHVGIYLPQPVFSHGQLYVALSRAKTAASVKILIKPGIDDISENTYTSNVVYQEILALANSI